MLTYDVENRGNKPLYEYIYSCIREDILDGRLLSGQRLPSKRELATDNGVALVTVENAYEQLIIEGYVEAKPRKGYFVADIEVMERDKDLLSKTNCSEAGKEDNTNCGINNFLADFTTGTVQSDAFPYTIWSKILRRIISDKERDFASAPPSEGMEVLRKAIASYLYRAKNLNVDAERIIVGPGTEYLHSILLQLIGRSRLVAVEDPGYKKAERIYESNGMKVMHIPLDEDGIEVDKLNDSNVKLVHVSPAHHFPTGIVMPASRRHKLIAWAKEQGAYIIEDDYDSEFRFKGRPMPTLASIDDERVIYMNTFTSSLSASIRIAYMVLPYSLMSLYKDRLSFVSGTVSTFEQLALAEFIDGGYYERHINRMRNRYRGLRDRYFEAIMKSNLAKRVEIQDDEAGLGFTLSIPDIKDDEKYLSELAQRGIIIRPLSDYCYNTADTYKSKFIIRYIEMDTKKLTEIFDLFP